MNSPLRLAMLAPLKRPITSSITASRPHLMYELIIRLIERGHKVTIFGTGDSQIDGATVIPVLPKSLSNLPPVENPFYQHTAAIAKMLLLLERKAKEFDLIHNHLYPEFFPLFLLKHLTVPMLTTVHAQMTPDLSYALRLFPEACLVAISHAHASLGKGLKFDIVYNGIDMEVYRLKEKPEGNYLLFLGRMTGQKDTFGRYLDPKGVLTAIEIAKLTGEKLLISGNVEDKKFYEEKVKRELSSRIQFIGKISSELPLSQSEVIGLMQNAKVLLFPINWQEPFGLVMVEAMACGTPVIAYGRGSVPEVVVDGVTGFVVEPETDSLSDLSYLSHLRIKKRGIEGLVEAVKRINVMSRQEYGKMRLACRRHAESKFSIERMVDDYERLYYRILGT